MKILQPDWHWRVLNMSNLCWFLFVWTAMIVCYRCIGHATQVQTCSQSITVFYMKMQCTAHQIKNRSSKFHSWQKCRPCECFACHLISLTFLVRFWWDPVNSYCEAWSLTVFRNCSFLLRCLAFMSTGVISRRWWSRLLATIALWHHVVIVIRPASRRPDHCGWAWLIGS